MKQSGLGTVKTVLQLWDSAKHGLLRAHRPEPLHCGLPELLSVQEAPSESKCPCGRTPESGLSSGDPQACLWPEGTIHMLSFPTCLHPTLRRSALSLGSMRNPNMGNRAPSSHQNQPLHSSYQDTMPEISLVYFWVFVWIYNAFSSCPNSNPLITMAT